MTGGRTDGVGAGAAVRGIFCNVGRVRVRRRQVVVKAVFC